MCFLKERMIMIKIIARNRCWNPMNAFKGTLKFFNIALSRTEVVVKRINAAII